LPHSAMFLRHGTKKHKIQLLIFVFKWTAAVSGRTWYDFQHNRQWSSNQVSCLVPDKYKTQASFRPVIKHHLFTLGSRTRCMVRTFNSTRVADLGAPFPSIVLTSKRPCASVW
jgi:hypothetical protein